MKSIIKYNTYLALSLLAALLSPMNLLAQIPLPDDLRPDFLPDVTRGDTAEEKIYGFVGDILITAMKIIGGVAIIFLIVTGIRYILAWGKEEKTTKAKTTLGWIIAGLILLILSYSIIQFVIKVTLVTQDI